MSAALYLAWRSADEAVDFSESLVRQALERALSAEIDWQELALGLDPPSVSLSNVRARWPGAPGTVVHGSRVVLRPALRRRGESLDFESARFEGLRVESPGLLPEPHPVALRWLDVEPASLLDDAKGVAATELWASGRGELAAGGTLEFEVRPRGARAPGSGGPEVVLHFANVPPGEWAVLVPELNDASGTISGELVVGFPGASSGSAGHTQTGVDGEPQSSGELSGRFDIDATDAELSVAGAYTKPQGDPATLTGRFVRTPEGRFELERARVSVRKAKPRPESSRSGT